MRGNPALASMGEYPLTALAERARAMRAGGQHLVDFSIGDPREPTPAFIRQALLEAVPEVSQYPSTKGSAYLRQAIADYVWRRFGVEVDPASQVLPTSGSKEAIFSTPLAFVDRGEGEGVVWATPGYPIYERGAMLAGARLFPIRLSDGFVLEAGDIPDRVWEQAAIVWLCSPHNPAGSITSIGQLAELYQAARHREVLICSDECYADLYDRAPPPSILQVAGPGSKGVLSYLSLSKRSGMTGYRSAAVVGDAEAISALVTLRSATGTAPPEFTQAAAAAAWADDDHAAQRREIFRRKRSVLGKGFADLGMPVVASEAGLYLWVRVDDDLAVAARLLEGGVVVSPGRVFGPGGEGYLRLALVPSLDECDQALAAVAACLSS